MNSVVQVLEYDHFWYRFMDRTHRGHPYGKGGGDGQKGKGKGKGKGLDAELIYTGEGWTLEQRLAVLDAIVQQMFRDIIGAINHLLRIYNEIMEQIRDHLPDPSY